VMMLGNLMSAAAPGLSVGNQVLLIVRAMSIR